MEKVSKLLGSTIDPDEMPGQRLPKKTDTVFQIKMTLVGIDPPIWRRIQTKDCTLVELHALVQITMGWDFEHLYRFLIGSVSYADLEMASQDDAEDACDTYLSEVLPVQNRRPRFDYEYDFGDQWMHQLIVEERFPPEPGVEYPTCVAGQRACPPEDCGGPWGYPDFVEAISYPDHREHDELLEWVGGEFDPGSFDLESVNKELRRMREKKMWSDYNILSELRRYDNEHKGPWTLRFPEDKIKESWRAVLFLDDEAHTGLPAIIGMRRAMSFRVQTRQDSGGVSSRSSCGVAITTTSAGQPAVPIGRRSASGLGAAAPTVAAPPVTSLPRHGAASKKTPRLNLGRALFAPSRPLAEFAHHTPSLAWNPPKWG
jgi:hypothetical protein